MREDLWLYLGGEDVFCHRLQQRPTAPRAVRRARPRELAAARVHPVLSELPMVIEGHAFTTGIVPRISMERCCRTRS